MEEKHKLDGYSTNLIQMAFYNGCSPILVTMSAHFVRSHPMAPGHYKCHGVKVRPHVNSPLAHAEARN